MNISNNLNFVIFTIFILEIIESTVIFPLQIFRIIVINVILFDNLL